MVWPLAAASDNFSAGTKGSGFLSAFIFWFLFLFSLPAWPDTAAANESRLPQDNSFSLQKVAGHTGYSSKFQGTSAYSWLLLQVSLLSGLPDKKPASHFTRENIYFRTDDQGNFQEEFFYPEPGLYQIIIFGKQSAQTRVYTGLAKVLVTVSGTLPEPLASQARVIYQPADFWFRLKAPARKTTDGIVQISGQSQYRHLWFRFLANGQEKHANLLLGENENFNALYRLKQGPGKYQVEIFGRSNLSSPSFTALASFEMENENRQAIDYESLAINQKILDFARAQLGQQVGRGECWDLAQQALDQNFAEWQRTRQYGRKINYPAEPIRAGDILQFTSVRLRQEKSVLLLGHPDHTAIVNRIYRAEQYQILHQNVNGQRSVQLSELDLSQMISGKIEIFRPVEGFWSP